VAASRIGAALVAPFLLADASITVDASVGAARYPEDAGNAEELLRRADAAMYAAKTSPPNSPCSTRIISRSGRTGEHVQVGPGR
jgi:predicted signal transduction protein with EAL and GGDEF domain